MQVVAGLGNCVRAIGRFGRRARRDEAGTTAIEFAFVIGPFLGLLFAIIEVAFVYFGQVSLDVGTATASRQLFVGAAQTKNMSAEDFKQIVCSNLAPFMTCGNVIVDVRSSDTFTDAANNLPKAVTSDGRLSDGFWQFNPGGASKVVVVTVYYDFTLLSSLPGLGDFTGKVGLGLGNLADGSRLMQTSMAFRTEPY